MIFGCLLLGGEFGYGKSRDALGHRADAADIDNICILSLNHTKTHILAVLWHSILPFASYVIKKKGGGVSQ